LSFAEDRRDARDEAPGHDQRSFGTAAASPVSWSAIVLRSQARGRKRRISSSIGASSRAGLPYQPGEFGLDAAMGHGGPAGPRAAPSQAARNAGILHRSLGATPGDHGEEPPA